MRGIVSRLALLHAVSARHASTTLVFMTRNGSAPERCGSPPRNWANRYGCVTSDSDEFGVPSNLFGSVPADFYGALGRIAPVGSRLEMRFAVVVAKVLDGDPDSTAGLCVPALNGMHKDVELSVGFEELRAQAVKPMKSWNQHLHSLWPQPTADDAYGWRAVIPKHRIEPAHSGVHIRTKPHQYEGAHSATRRGRNCIAWPLLAVALRLFVAN